MNVLQGQTLLCLLECDEPEDNVILILSDLLLRMYEVFSDITTIYETIEVSKYVLKYNCRPPYTNYDLNLMRSEEDKVLSWLVDVTDEIGPITVYDNYVEALDRMKNMLRNDK